MKQQIQFSLLEILQNVGEYVLIRKTDIFPDYLPGTDIDILCLDKYHSMSLLQPYLVNLLDGEEFYLRVREAHSHLLAEIMTDGQMNLRIDLIDSLEFKTFTVQPALKTHMFMHRQQQLVEQYPIYLSSKDDDLLIRYLAYLEWFEQRPDKIKHLDYILANATEEERERLIHRTHQFIRLQPEYWEGPVGFQGRPPHPYLQKTVVRMRKTLLYRLLRKIYRTFKKIAR